MRHGPSRVNSESLNRQLVNLGPWPTTSTSGTPSLETGPSVQSTLITLPRRAEGKGVQQACQWGIHMRRVSHGHLTGSKVLVADHVAHLPMPVGELADQHRSFVPA
jgi:hypothetical protein